MTPTAALADYVLPAATWLERCSIGYPTMDVEQVSMAGSMPVLERFEGGTDIDFRDDYEFWYGLSERLGFADKWWGPKYEDMMNDQVAPFGMKFRDFCEKVKYLKVPNVPEKYKEPGFKFLTPTGKVELYSTGSSRSSRRRRAATSTRCRASRSRRTSPKRTRSTPRSTRSA